MFLRSNFSSEFQAQVFVGIEEEEITKYIDDMKRIERIFEREDELLLEIFHTEEESYFALHQVKKLFILY